MAEPNLTPPLHEPPPLDAGHQPPEDVPVNAIFKYILWFVGAVIVIHGIILLYMFLLSGLFSGTQQGPQSAKDLVKRKVPLPRQGDPFAQPGPQRSDVADLKKLREKEKKILERPPWVDREGVVHIPIDQAINLLAEPKTARSHGIRWHGEGDGTKEKGAGP
jgi:hypothetical protein